MRASAELAGAAPACDDARDRQNPTPTAMTTTPAPAAIHRRPPGLAAACVGSFGSVDARAVIPSSDGPRASSRQVAAHQLTSPHRPAGYQADELRRAPPFLHDRIESSRIDYDFRSGASREWGLGGSSSECAMIDAWMPNSSGRSCPLTKRSWFNC